MDDESALLDTWCKYSSREKDWIEQNNENAFETSARTEIYHS